MTNYDRPAPPETRPTQPGAINYNDIDMSSRNRNDNVNANANRNVNANRNDNVNANRNDNVNNNRANSDANANSRSNSDANSRSNSDANSRSNSDSRATVGDVKATGGAANATGGNSRSDAQGGRGGNSNISDNSRTNYYGGSASAPNVYASGFCSEGGSAGVYILGIGVSGGKTTINESCLKMQDFRETMTSVCRASDEHAQVALSSFQLELEAGKQMSSNPMAESVGRRVSRVSDAKAMTSMQLDNVCTTLATGSTANVETLKAAGLDRPLIITQPAGNERDQRILDEALATKVDQINREVQTLKERPIVIQNNVEVGVGVAVEAPKPVHRPPSTSTHRVAPPAKKDDDCDDAKASKKK